MTGTCRAAVFLGDETYEVREFPMPDPPPGGAVLQVEAVGLCGSDVAQFHGHRARARRRGVPRGARPRDRRARRQAGARRRARRGRGRPGGGRTRSCAGFPLRLYGYSDMTGDGEVGLWGGYGEYMEIFAGTELLRMSRRRPAEHLTLFEPLANAVNWVDIVGGRRGRHRRRAGPRATRAWRCSRRCWRSEPARSSSPAPRRTGCASTPRRRSAPPHVVMVDVDDAGEVVRDLTGGAGRRRGVRRGHRDRRPCRWRSTSRAAVVASCSPGSSTSPRSPASSPTTSC